ncbi:MAG: ankyrin repeat domain-containing protein [Bacteroidales bacterium]|nr:ankyrin repeat domain-containing protein [Bacteroidales bacterium]
MNAISDQRGLTALHIAAQQGFTDAARILLENGALVNMRTISGFTALDYALANRHDQIVNILKQYGAYK